MDKNTERQALDRLKWFTHTEVVYSKDLDAKKKEYQIKYINGDRCVTVTYLGYKKEDKKNGGRVEVLNVESNF